MTMKFRLLVKLGELILGKAFGDQEHRADMYLPVKVLALGLVLLVGAVILGVVAVVLQSLPAAAGAVIALPLGLFALLCWKNQTIQMLPNDAFEYTTLFGNKKMYRFSDVKALRRNSDSMTLFVGEGRVHIESCAILSDRLVDRINKQLESIYKVEQ